MIPLNLENVHHLRAARLWIDERVALIGELDNFQVLDQILAIAVCQRGAIVVSRIRVARQLRVESKPWELTSSVVYVPDVDWIIFNVAGTEASLPLSGRKQKLVKSANRTVVQIGRCCPNSG